MIVWGQTRRGRTDWQPSCVLYHRQPPFVKTLLTRDDLCSLIGNIGYRRNRKHVDWQLLRKLGGGKQEGFSSFRRRCISNRQMCLWSGLLKCLVLRQNLYPRRYRATMKWVRASKLICIFKFKFNLNFPYLNWENSNCPILFLATSVVIQVPVLYSSFLVTIIWVLKNLLGYEVNTCQRPVRKGL